MEFVFIEREISISRAKKTILHDKNIILINNMNNNHWIILIHNIINNHYIILIYRRPKEHDIFVTEIYFREYL